MKVWLAVNVTVFVIAFCFYAAVDTSKAEKFWADVIGLVVLSNVVLGLTALWIWAL